MQKGSSLEIYLCRHGETLWSSLNRHTGRTDLELTHRGCEEAKALAAPLHKIHWDAVFSSPLKRALQTCQLAQFEDQVQIDPRLVEWDYGDYEGMTSEQIREMNPGWDLFRDGAKGGESKEQMIQRADALLEDLRKIQGRVLLFSHGHFSRVVMMRWIQGDLSLARSFVLNPTSFLVLGYDRLNPVVIRWNYTFALSF